MDIRHLRYFLALAEELHFGRAAERAHIEQSPLSRTISQLEDELGVPLFIRSRQGTTLTPAGEALREPAREILTAIEQARRKVAAVGGLPAVLRIGLSDGLVGEASADTMRGVRRVLRTERHVLEPRKMWPGGAFGTRGKIPVAVAADAGRVLVHADAPEWSDSLAGCLADGSAADPEHFRGVSVHQPTGRVYGGQVLAQKRISAG